MASQRVRIVKWGNSHAVRIPKDVLDHAHLKNGSELGVVVEDGRIVLEPAKKRATLKALLARITNENLHGEQNWGAPAGHEPW